MINWGDVLAAMEETGDPLLDGVRWLTAIGVGFYLMILSRNRHELLELLERRRQALEAAEKC